MSMVALESVISLFRDPTRVEEWRARALPDGLSAVIRIAAGDEELASAWASESGESAATVADACVFFLQQVLFAPGSDSYRVLGVPPDAPQAKLREHYGLLMRWLHPDRQGEDGWESVYADRVNQAWQDLKTPQRRAEYDAQPRGAATPGSRRSTSLAPYRAPPGLAQPPARAPVLSGSMVQRLPAITLGVLGLVALATVALVYWSRQSNDPYRWTRAPEPVAVAAQTVAEVERDALASQALDGAGEVTGAPVDAPDRVAADAGSDAVDVGAGGAIAAAQSVATGGRVIAVAEPESRPIGGAAAPPVESWNLTAGAERSAPAAPVAVTSTVHRVAARDAPAPRPTEDPPSANHDVASLPVVPVKLDEGAAVIGVEPAGGAQVFVDRANGRVAAGASGERVANAGSPEPTVPPAPAPPSRSARVASAEGAIADAASSATLSIAATTARAAPVQRAPEVGAPSPATGAKPPAAKAIAASTSRSAALDPPASAGPVQTPLPPTATGAAGTAPAAPPETPAPMVASGEGRSASELVAAAAAVSPAGLSVAVPSQPRAAEKPESLAPQAASSAAAATVAVTPTAAPAHNAPPVSVDVAAGLIQDLAAAYAAGNVQRFDQLLGPESGREALSLRKHLLASDMRFLELRPGAWRSRDGVISSEVRFRLTVLPKGERKAQTKAGTLAVDVAMVDGEARITRFDWPTAGRP